MGFNTKQTIHICLLHALFNMKPIILCETMTIQALIYAPMTIRYRYQTLLDQSSSCRLSIRVVLQGSICSSSRSDELFELILASSLESNKAKSEIIKYI